MRVPRNETLRQIVHTTLGGDRVRVTETRPLSKLKRWRVTDVLERAR